MTVPVMVPFLNLVILVSPFVQESLRFLPVRVVLKSGDLACGPQVQAERAHCNGVTAGFCSWWPLSSVLSLQEAAFVLVLLFAY